MPGVTGSGPSEGPADRPDDYHAAKSLKELQRAGGYDAKAIMYGAWDFLSVWNSYVFKGRAVISDYAYRGMPAAAGWGWPGDTGVLVRKTRPRITAEIGCPAFKTQKLLAGRALVSDSFGRSWNSGNYNQPTRNPGDGQYAHRDGYNVLYGDWHAAWYGDPNLRFIWWPVPQNPSSAGHLWAPSATAATGIYWYLKLDGTSETYGNDANSSQGAWLLLDRAAGIDLNDAD
jgi:prepilin-type processing-associated H-X9-DG protein